MLAAFIIIGVVILLGHGAGRLLASGPTAQRVLSRAAFLLTHPALLPTVLVRADATEILSA